MKDVNDMIRLGAVSIDCKMMSGRLGTLASLVRVVRGLLQQIAGKRVRTVEREREEMKSTSGRKARIHEKRRGEGREGSERVIHKRTNE
jgi:hypothetical protein